MRKIRTLLAALLLAGRAAWASMGLTTIPPLAPDGPVTVFYPAAAAEQTLTVGRGLLLSAAREAPPQRGNGRLVIVSHGSGGAPWVHADLARQLVEAGFVVALPEHFADHYKDDSNPGPDSWTLRPGEVSRAIDAVGRDPRFAPLLALDRVGAFGISAGGHTVLTLVGGRWSPANFMRHCDQNLEADFQFCTGLITHLTGGWLDGLRKWVARAVIRHRFSDETLRQHEDPRIAAAVVAVPAAADFELESLARPRVPLGVVSSGRDRWLVPRFHSDRLLSVCESCERLADLPEGGHGAMLSPPPPALGGVAAEMLNDPPGYDRRQTAAAERAVAAFFVRHLAAP